MTEPAIKLLGALPYIKPEVTTRLGEKVLSLDRDNSPVLKKWLDGLRICFLYDEGESFAYIQNRTLAQAGKDEDQLLSLSINNLNHLSYEIKLLGNVFAVIAGGNFEASMVFHENIIAFINENCEGHAIAAIPTRDVFAFCASTNLLGIENLRGIILRLKTCEDHPITCSLLEYKEFAWKYYDG